MNSTTLTGLRRRAGWDRNPLRRAEDRIQSAISAVLLLIFLIAGPFVALAVAEPVYVSGVAIELHDQAALHRVDSKASAPADYGITLATRTGWVDGQGRPTHAPREHVSTIAESGAAGASALAGLAVLLWCGFAVARSGLDRRRYRRWEADWIRAESRWRRRA